LTVGIEAHKNAELLTVTAYGTYSNQYGYDI